MKGADLRGSQLRRANLQFADLRRTDLEDADLRGALLIGADLRGTDLDAADLRGAIFNYETRFPAGFDPHEAGMAYWEIDEDILNTHRIRRKADGLNGGYWRYWRY